MFNISVQTASDSCRLGQSWSGAHKMPSFYFLFVFWRVKSISFTVGPESDHCCCQVGDREVVTWHVRGRELLPLLCDRCDPKETLGRLSAFSSPFVVTATWKLFCRLSFDDRIIMTSQWVWNYFRFRPQSVAVFVLSVSVKLQRCLSKCFMWDIAWLALYCIVVPSHKLVLDIAWCCSREGNVVLRHTRDTLLWCWTVLLCQRRVGSLHWWYKPEAWCWTDVDY